MKKLIVAFGISLTVWFMIPTSPSIAQDDLPLGDGFITRLPPEPPDPDIPPEAQDLPRQILHQVSGRENLHLLAGYYYGDPRQWKKIYYANRRKIKNPNRLENGQILKIPVRKDWYPKYDYQEWIRLAQRGGEWVPRAKRKAPVIRQKIEPGKEEPTVQTSPPVIQQTPPLEKEQPKVEMPQPITGEKKEGSQM
jgi:hypothetical protein